MPSFFQSYKNNGRKNRDSNFCPRCIIFVKISIFRMYTSTKAINYYLLKGILIKTK
jgi:hypothetical protein